MLLYHILPYAFISLTFFSSAKILLALISYNYYHVCDSYLVPCLLNPYCIPHIGISSYAYTIPTEYLIVNVFLKISYLCLPSTQWHPIIYLIFFHLHLGWLMQLWFFYLTLGLNCFDFTLIVYQTQISNIHILRQDRIWQYTNMTVWGMQAIFIK